jgi:hypothetical protein
MLCFLRDACDSFVCHAQVVPSTPLSHDELVLFGEGLQVMEQLDDARSAVDSCFESLQNTLVRTLCLLEH